jgi:MoaA/NifB/PqqE/SkfB family radical SAM enzyme
LLFDQKALRFGEFLARGAFVVSPDLPIEPTEIPDLRAQSHALNANPVFCMIPWLHMHVMPNSTVTPCCVWPYDDVFGDGKNQKIQEIWNSEKFRQLRSNMLAGRPSKGCDRCYTVEKAGFPSLRTSTNNRFAQLAKMVQTTASDGTFSEFKPRYVDIRFSNLCNFRCRGCSPALSSSWYDDHQRLFNYKSEERKVVSIAADAPQFWQDLKVIIPDAEEIYFGGGEPLIAREHFEVLKLLIAVGRTSIWLSYNTNLSTLTYGQHDLARMWSQFERVTVGISLDDIGERAEYFRKGTDWKILTQNMERIRTEFPTIARYVNCTVNIHNVFYLPEIVDWLVFHEVIQLSGFNVNLLLGPEEYVLHVLPSNLKLKVREKLLKYVDRCASARGWGHIADSFRNVIAFMDQEDASDRLEKFRSRTRAMDEIRSEKFIDVFPELRELMESP